MADTCLTSVEISARTPADIPALQTLHDILVQNKGALFTSLIPCPPTVEDWYTWALENWGCRSNPSTVVVEPVISTDTSTYFYMDVDTPWAPPTEFIKTMSARYPGLTFSLSYEELGLGLVLARYLNGQVV